MSDTPLSEIFGSNQEQPIAEELLTEQPEVSTEGQPRDEFGRFAPKGEEAPAVEPDASAPPAPEPERIPIAALKDERHKRQQLEEQLRQLTEQVARFQQPQPQPEFRLPDPVEDPEGFAAFQHHQVLNAKLDISEEITRTAVGDEVVDAARDWAVSRFRDNPAFQQTVLSQRNPWGYVVKEYQQSQKMAKLADFDVGDIDAFLQWKQNGAAGNAEQMKAQLREELMAELNLRPQVPTTLAGDRSVGSRSGPAWTGPTPVSDIFGR